MQHRQLVFDVEVLERTAELLEVDDAIRVAVVSIHNLINLFESNAMTQSLESVEQVLLADKTLFFNIKFVKQML